ncbi:sigma factor-like helix-turn-helix DNA-binding protein [Corallococcus exiguus]|uniref:sigma factor-like helix-turn-helix DNA-binding protein n=1 Tax=Corallococcus exiguus TaxID=83462 RepID=UPI0014947C0D|nr:sigma factor-like helix-turn-helix DNA-binding protein [Corallococcus exiguus]NPD24439.1 RNA polymerase subunit sigma-70 [Corallococcus exiguus]NRD44461.1 RNA polymerase subunit sigma-70 [Corallococcus exiguus]
MSGPVEAGGLAALLRTHVPSERRAQLEEGEDLEALLREHLTVARNAWPSVALATESFLRHLALHLPDTGAVAVLRECHAADLYLACACGEGHPAALRAFEQHLLQQVPSRLASMPRTQVDEALQLLRERLLMGSGGEPPRILTYSGRGALLAWVVISTARIASQLKTRDARQELFDEPPEALVQLLSTGDPEHELLRKDLRELLVDVLRKVLEALPPRERTLLRLHHLHGFTMDRLATMYGESRSGVARRVLQSRERLLKLLRAELAGRLKPDDAALDSLLGLVNSQLDLSLNRLME